MKYSVRFDTTDPTNPGEAREEAEEIAREYALVTTASKVSALRPDLAANDAIAATLTAEPTLTAEEVIDILDEATEDWARENGK